MGSQTHLDVSRGSSVRFQKCTIPEDHLDVSFNRTCLLRIIRTCRRVSPYDQRLDQRFIWMFSDVFVFFWTFLKVTKDASGSLPRPF